MPNCTCLEWHTPPVEQVDIKTEELTLVDHIEFLIDSVQEARDYLITSDTPTRGYPTKSVEAVSAWLTQLDHQAVDAVIQELQSQRLIWGEEHDMNHSPFEWAAIITKYVGRYVDRVDNPLDQMPSRDELIRIAAVAISAWITHAKSGRP